MTVPTHPATAAAYEPGAADLGRLLGDPWDTANPVGFAAVLAADERGEMLAEGEKLLDAYGLGAEFVPPGLGGRFHRLDRLIGTMRTVVRRDPTLAYGYGMSSLMAAVNVWTAGRAEQAQEVAGLLLDNHKLACAYHELDHGNDLARAEFSARVSGAGLRLNGRKEVVTNIDRATALLLFARTGDRPGSRNHSQLLVRPTDLPSQSVRHLPRHPTSGVRGVPLSGMEFHDCPLPADAVVGALGQGLETSLRAFQITRIVLPGMALGVVETALEIVLRYARGRRLYGRPMLDLPYVRGVIAEAFADLLLCDGLTTVAARALHLLPDEASVHAAAVKYLVPRILMAATGRLATLLGSGFYVREGDSALMDKLLRDVQPAGFVHASGAICQMTMLPQLPALARRSWRSSDPAPDGVFRLHDALPPVPYQELTVRARGRDHLAPSVVTGLDLVPDTEEHRRLRHLGAVFSGELDELAGDCADLTPPEQSVTASHASYELTARYAAVLAAGSCLSLWAHGQQDADPFLRDPGWVTAALTRLIAHRRAQLTTLPDDLREHLIDELIRRESTGASFGLALHTP